MTKRLPNLEEFITTALSNSWGNHRDHIREVRVRAYLRFGKRYFSPAGEGPQVFPSIDLASVYVPEAFQRKGFFKEFLTKLEQIADQYGQVVYVESVANEDLSAYLQRRPGYIFENINDWPPCFYRMPVARKSE